MYSYSTVLGGGTNRGRGENTEDKQEHKSATEILCDVTYLLSINITYI